MRLYYMNESAKQMFAISYEKIASNYPPEEDKADLRSAIFIEPCCDEAKNYCDGDVMMDYYDDPINCIHFRYILKKLTSIIPDCDKNSDPQLYQRRAVLHVYVNPPIRLRSEAEKERFDQVAIDALCAAFNDDKWNGYRIERG